MLECKTCRWLLMDLQTFINRFVPRIFVSSLTHPVFGVSFFFPKQFTVGVLNSFLRGVRLFPGGGVHLSPMAVSGAPDVSQFLSVWQFICPPLACMRWVPEPWNLLSPTMSPLSLTVFPTLSSLFQPVAGSVSLLHPLPHACAGFRQGPGNLGT